MDAPTVSLFGQMLRRYRAAANLSQEELAEQANLSARAISDLERGVKRTPHKETIELLANALALPPQKRALFVAAARPALAPPATVPALHLHESDLTAPLTSLIGRERELLALTRMLGQSDVRLLTLTGTGGVGKTRLALHLAEELAADFDDGAYLVSLAPVRDARLVAPAIARTLGLHEEPGAPALQQVIAYLCERQSLVILDNVEHVVAIAPDIAALLARCPRVRMLITSRRPLRIRGEREFPLSPLDLDAAVRLFLDRVHAAEPDHVASREASNVARLICLRLDCLPLALELAAVRARTLPLPVLLQRLESSLTVLTVGLRDLPERQQTLGGTIAWGVDLLDEGEQCLFRRIAVFVGGCSLEAAHALYEPHDVGRSAVFDSLAALAEMSLLRLDVAEQDVLRFTMLETIREYALESLHQSGEEQTARERHARFFAALTEQMRAETNQDACDERLLRDIENLRAALRWAIGNRQSSVGLRLGANLARLWNMRGFANEGEAWLRALLELDAATEERADPQLRLEALYGASRFAMDRLDYARAEALAEESLALAQQTANIGALANALATLGHVAEAHKRYAEAHERFDTSLRYSRQANDIAGVGRAASSLGNLARMRGEYTYAVTYLEESLDIARQMQMTWGIINGLTSLGHVACEQADYPRATTLYRESLTFCSTMPNEAMLAWLLEGVAVVIAARGDNTQAARLCGMIAQLRHESGMTTSRHAWAIYAQTIETVRATLDPSAWTIEYETGRTFTAADGISAARGALA